MGLTAIASLSSRAKAILCLVTLLPLYYFSYTLRTSEITSGGYPRPGSQPSADFISQWLNSSLLGPFDPVPIHTHCAETQWRPNLIFKIDETNGGIGNVRAHVLDFAFFAIEAGAAMVLPSQTVRSTSDLFDVWHGQQANFSRMFDDRSFLERVKEACPGLKVYRPAEVEKLVQKGEVKVVSDGYDARSRRVDFDPGNTRDAAVGYLTAWLKSHGVDITKTKAQVTVRHTMWEVDTPSLGSSLRHQIGQLFPFRADSRRHAALAVHTLATRYDLPVDASDHLHERAFYGAHLRTEQDTLSAGWFSPNTATEVGLNYTEQTDAYLAHAGEHSLHVMYVATGNATELERFKAKAAAASPSVTVTSKWDLLPPDAAQALGELDWDQQALVDMEILMKCSVFGGFAKSSFAFAIAVARNTYLEAHGRPLGYNWRMREVNPLIAFDDGLSRILGRNEMNERYEIDGLRG